MVDALIAHYDEIGLKGGNRHRFEDQLMANLKRALRATGYRRVRCEVGRITVDFKLPDLVSEAAASAACVFGVANVGAGLRVEPDLASIGNAALELMTEGSFDSFAVRARRARSSCPVDSRHIERSVGGMIQERTGAPVDLENPDATLYVELFSNSGLAYRDRRPGSGGLPVGTSGKLIALMSGGIDSPVAAWRMMRRGAEVELLHFHGRPYTDASSVTQAFDLSRALSRYHLATTLHLVPLGDAQAEVVAHCPPRLRLLLYRRLMLRIAAALADERDAAGLVTGDSLGQVSSQTLDNLATTDAAVRDRQVLRPLIGTDKLEIVRQAEAIGTLQISNRRHQESCVLFDARSTSTHTSVGQAEDAEGRLDIGGLVGKALARRESQVVEAMASR